jgi:arylsulfatase A-like enzyme
VLHGISDLLALRQGDWKCIPANAKGHVANMGSGANPSEARFAASRIPEPLLFNLATDPNETTNLAGKHPERVAEMQKRLNALKRAPAE